MWILIKIKADVWYPIPFLIFGGFSAIAAILFSIFIPETKNKKSPDTIEEFINGNETENL